MRSILFSLLIIFLVSGCTRNTIQIGGDEKTPLKISSDGLYLDPVYFGIENAPNVSIDTSYGNDISLEVSQPAQSGQSGESSAF